VAGDPDTLPDAYRSERYLGNILRYLMARGWARAAL